MEVKRNRGAKTVLTVYDELYTVYLHEIQSQVEDTTATVSDKSTICYFIQHKKVSMKKLYKIALDVVKYSMKGF